MTHEVNAMKRKIFLTLDNIVFCFCLIGFTVIFICLAVADTGQASGKAPEVNPSLQAAISGNQIQRSAAADKIEGKLKTDLEANGSADFIVRFAPQADLSPAYAMDWNARGKFVYHTLRDTSAKSQVNAKAILDTGGLKYRTFIAGNDLYVWGGTMTAANDLAALPEVYFIRSTRTYNIDPIVELKPLQDITWAGDLLARNAFTSVGASPDALDWGIMDTKADQFWTTYNVQGDGIVVANIDTGVQWDHPALDQAFKCGTDPTDPTCWYDPTNRCHGDGACDNIGHGTHTMGTMVGDDDPSLSYQVGMAPNAQWIACKGCEGTRCTDVSMNACADWILAPNNDSANRPNVVNNSWGGGGGDAWYLAKVQAWRAAGIFPAFSAGNSTGCGSIGSPGDYQESFASTGHNSSRNHVFSEGPSNYGHDPYTKPNISAPASSVCSSVPTNGWSCIYSGTSMASPHSAGAVALLWSCNSSLVGQIDQTFEILQNAADAAPTDSCGAPPDGEGNYTYGYGYLDILAAGQAGCAPTAGDMIDLTAAFIPGAIQLRWKSFQEIDLLGFNIYRADGLDRSKEKLNPELIPALTPGQLTGNYYQYVDATVVGCKSYYYWIEWVGSAGSKLIGPLQGILANYIWLPLGFR